jgi:hypothetical protein
MTKATTKGTEGTKRTTVAAHPKAAVLRRVAA